MRNRPPGSVPRFVGARISVAFRLEIQMPDSLPPTIPEVTTGPLPASRKVHVAGRLHPQIRVAMREIDLSPAAKEPRVAQDLRHAG